MDPPLYPLHIPRVDPTRAEAETLQQSSPLADGIKLQKKDNPTPPPVCVCVCQGFFLAPLYYFYNGPMSGSHFKISSCSRLVSSLFCCLPFGGGWSVV